MSTVRPVPRTRSTSAPAAVAGLASGSGFLGQAGSFVDAAKIVGVAPHVTEYTGGRVGIGERGNAGVIENGDAFGDELSAHPTCEHGLSRAARVRLECFGDAGRVRHALRGEDGEQGVAVGVADGDVAGFDVSVHVGVAQDVDGVGVAPMRREKAA